MSRTKAPLSQAAMLGLALSVSTSCAQIAAAAPVVVGTAKSESVTAYEAEQKAKLRKGIKTSAVSLRQMRASLEEGCQILSTDAEIPMQVLADHPYEQIVSTLRDLEEIGRSVASLADLPVIGDEYRSLLRQLAQVRSLAVRNQILINQRLQVAQVFESDVSADGLKDLADMATARLHRLAS